MNTLKKLMMTASIVLAPTAAMAAQGTAGVLAEACNNDPHHSVYQALWADGRADTCAIASPTAQGVHGPAGPIMVDAQPARQDPFRAYDEAFTGD